MRQILRTILRIRLPRIGKIHPGSVEMLVGEMHFLEICHVTKNL